MRATLLTVLLTATFAPAHAEKPFASASKDVQSFSGFSWRVAILNQSLAPNLPVSKSSSVPPHFIATTRSRLCVGLAVRLLRPVFPQHHAQKWPSASMISGATRLSQNHSFRYKTRTIPIQSWALRCMDGVFRSLMQTIPALPAPL
jgi:hypothetical protein